jgi:hypothetical protein
MKKKKQNKDLNIHTTAKTLSIFEKFKLVNEALIKEATGELFHPTTVGILYDADLAELTFKKHYYVYMTLMIKPEVSPYLEVSFTSKGIKKLLKTNQKMIDEVEELYSEYFEGDEIEF